MKRFRGLICAIAIAVSLTPMTVSATGNTLDDVINQETNETQEQPVQEQAPVQNNTQGSSSDSLNGLDGIYRNGAIIDDVQNASDLGGPSAGASKVNQGIKKVASFIIQILAYGVTILMVVRVMLDLCYIALPFTRSILANGYAGQPMGQQGMGMGQPGMGGMGGMNGMAGGMGMGGMNGMGMGGMGGYGMRGRMGMGGMGMNGMGMGQQGMSQPGATPAMGRVQWVSTAALNAVASESMPGPDGRTQSPLKMYAKDMTAMLIVTPILMVLAVTGALTDLGFLLGEVLAKAISGLGGMF